MTRVLRWRPNADQNREETAVWVLAFVFAILIASGYLLKTKPDTVPEDYAILGLLICWAGMAPSVEYIFRRRRPAMPLMPLTGIYYVLAFGLPVFRDTSFQLFAQISKMALFLTLAGVCAFYAGYLFIDRFYGPRIRPARLPGLAAGGKLQQSLWTLLGFHLASVYITPLGELPSLGQFFNAAGFLALGMFFWQYLDRRMKAVEGLFFILALIATLAPRIVSGFLWQVLELGIFLLIIYVVQRSRIPWVRLTVFVSMVMVFQAAKGEYRTLTWGTNTRYGDAGTLDKLRALGDVVAGWVEARSALDTASDSAQSVTGRLSMIGFLSYVMDQTPEVVPYWRGETYVNLIYKLIPRLLWADKPTESLGYEFTARYGMRDPGDTTTSFNVPWIVELYANFGSFGVIIGMGAFGGIFALLEGKLNRRSMPTLSLIVGITILKNLWYQESNFSLTVGSTAMLWASFYVYFWFMLKRVPRATVDDQRGPGSCHLDLDSVRTAIVRRAIPRRLELRG